MKVLNGAELAGYMKANQARMARSLLAQKIQPKLVIIRDNDSPVIMKYVQLKQQYGEDIDIIVEDWLREDIAEAIQEANADKSVHGIIVQLPLKNAEKADNAIDQILPDKDVDGLASNVGNEAVFESATATAINWLVSGYDIELKDKKIALVGRGRLVGAPLEKMWRNSGYDVTVFHRGDDLQKLKEFEVIVSATGVPHLITEEMVKPGAVVVDAGTASENGVLVGDIDNSVRENCELKAITPRIGGVGPLTVTALFEHVLIAASNTRNQDKN